jgi:tRNA A37 methylthiotransferase MiaB
LSGLRLEHSVRLVAADQHIRDETDAPDIDGRILLEKPAPVGEFVNVRITGTQVYDLVGEVVS